MLVAIGQLLPLALAVALSTVPLLVTLILLMSSRRGTALAYLIGWTAGLFLVTGVFALSFTLLPPVVLGGPSPIAGWLEVLIGVVLFGVGISQLLRPRPEEPVEPKWLGRLNNIPPAGAVGVGLALNVRPKALVLAIAAGIVLVGHRLTPAQGAVSLGIYVLVGVSSVAVPVVMTLISPDRMKAPLRILRDRIVSSSRVITIVVLMLVGFVILGVGLGNL